MQHGIIEVALRPMVAGCGNAGESAATRSEDDNAVLILYGIE